MKYVKAKPFAKLSEKKVRRMLRELGASDRQIRSLLAKLRVDRKGKR